MDDQPNIYNPYRPGANYGGTSRPWNEGLGEIVGVIDMRSVAFIDHADHTTYTSPVDLPKGTNVEVKDVQVVGSFNWTIPGSKDAKILIPGSPPIWKNDPVPFELKPDSEVYGELKTSTVLSPSSPVNETQNLEQAESSSTSASAELGLLAIMACVSVCAPAFPWSDVDILTGKDSLVCLFRWLAGRSGPDQGFRVDLSLAGSKTIVLTRWIPRREQKATPKSFGVSYERDQTRPAVGCENSRWGGHQRVISYDFGGLRVVCRSQGNARLPLREDEMLAEDLAKSTISEDLLPTEPQSFESLGSLTYRQAGTMVPQDDIVELVTRTRTTYKKVYKHRDAYPGLALSATPNNIIALHHNGEFYQVRHERVPEHPSMIGAAKDTAGDFVRMRVLLALIRDLVVRAGSKKRLSLLCRDNQLEVYEREEGLELPEQLKAAFV